MPFNLNQPASTKPGAIQVDTMEIEKRKRRPEAVLNLDFEVV